MQTTQQITTAPPVEDNKVQAFNTALPNHPIITGVIAHNDHIAQIAEGLLAAVPLPLDMTAMLPEAITALDAKMQEIHGKMNDAVAKQESYRKPITQAWDSNVLKKFTGSENRVKAAIAALLESRKKIAAEIHRRNNKTAADNAKLIAKQNERINYVTSAKKYLSERTIAFSATRVEAIVRRFYSIGLQDFEVYIKNLTDWKPALTDAEFHELCHGFTFSWIEHDLTKETAPVMNTEELAALKKEMDALFFQMVNTEKEVLQSKGPQRKLELQSGVSMDCEVEVSNQLADFKRTSTHVAASSQVGIETDAAVKKVEAQFEVNAATQTVQQSSGTSQRKIMELTTPVHVMAVLQKWIAEEFPHCTMEELLKKFDFAVKKMNEMGNITNVWPADVPLVDDFSVRSGRGRSSKKNKQDGQEG